MPISATDLVQQFGAAAESHNGCVFVGAGLSRAAGYPDWAGLVRPLRRTAKVPSTIRDLPLVAEYFENGVPGGRDRLEASIAEALLAVQVDPTAGHRQLARLPIDTFWTTNYDPLLELAVGDATLITTEADLHGRDIGHRRVIKLHGSLGAAGWSVPPVISRSDFETYARRHPRMWAALEATYLTQAMLFLGFSFDDPNVEVLLRLARTSLDLSAPEHFTILRLPTSSVDLAAHVHRVRDLERSGVAVCEIVSFAELEPILSALARRTRPRSMFVAGSYTDTESRLVQPVAQALASLLADDDLTISSLSGSAARDLIFALGEQWLAEGRYKPERLIFNYRQSADPRPLVGRRIGSVVFHSDTDKYRVRRSVIDECRVLCLIGGGPNSAVEAEIADDLGIPVVPMASTGGAAARWHALGPRPWVDGNLTQNWELLANPSPAIAAAAAHRLITSALKAALVA